MDNVFIREINREELSNCLEVIHRSFRTVAEEFDLTQENCPGHTSFLPLNRLEECFDKGHKMYGLFENDGLTGFVSLFNKGSGIFELNNLAVLPEKRHKGYGKMLLDFAKANVKEQCGNKISIGIINESTVLKNWYMANGFVPVTTMKFEHLPFIVGYLEYVI